MGEIVRIDDRQFDSCIYAILDRQWEEASREPVPATIEQ